MSVLLSADHEVDQLLKFLLGHALIDGQLVLHFNDLLDSGRHRAENLLHQRQSFLAGVVPLARDLLHLFQVRRLLFEQLDAKLVIHASILPRRRYYLDLDYHTLVLFDIDGTLLRRAGPHHREALVQGIRRVTGLDTTTEDIPVQGMLDPDILAIMMERAGWKRSQIRKALPDVQHAAERWYLRACPALHDKHCPGVAATLEKLSRRGALLGLVTGNLTRIGWRKLQRAGLRDYFVFGAFGEMAKTRGGLVKLAIREARQNGWIAKSTPMSLVGDAPQDIVAARENGIRSISVQTGITPVAELEAERPDVFLKDLRALRLWMTE